MAAFLLPGSSWFVLNNYGAAVLYTSSRELAGNGSVNFAGEGVLLRFDVR